ncbi:MAG: PAS domain-containing protein, partial [Rhodospirillaceae bacterium]|nr:PAS domain-containing protein [Rhodospirillaceae bacterium]
MSRSASESDEAFRGLVESAVEGFFIHRDFKPLFANQACADIFGYDSPEDVLALEKVLVFWAPNE